MGLFFFFAVSDFVCILFFLEARPTVGFSVHRMLPHNARQREQPVSGSIVLCEFLTRGTNLVHVPDVSL